MGRRVFNIKQNQVIKKCPKCGNNTSFVGRSEQVAEDICDVWVECKCGYDPTQYKIGHRLEDVWGTIDNENLSLALDIWNEEIEEDEKSPAKTGD